MKWWLAALGALAVVGLVVAPPAAAQEDDEDDLTAPDHLLLVAQTSRVVPNGEFRLSVEIDEPPPNALLRFGLHGRVRTRGEFTRSVSGDDDNLRQAIHQAELPLAEVAHSGDAYQLGINTAEGVEGAIPLAEPGVYPVVVDLRSADGSEIVDRLVTHLVRLPAPNPAEQPMRVATIVPLHAPPAHTSAGAVDAEIVAPLVPVLNELGAVDVPLTLAPTPESIDALADEPAVADQLRAVVAGRQVTTSPYVRLDPSSWVDAGMVDALGQQIDRGAAELEAELGVVDRGTWVAAPDSTPDRETLSALAGRGVRAVVLPAAALESDDDPPEPGRAQLVGLGDNGAALSTLVADDALTARIGESDDAVLDAHQLLAELGVLAALDPTEARAVAVQVPDEAARDPLFLRTLLVGLADPTRSQRIAPVTVADALAAAPPERDESAEAALLGGDEDRDLRELRSFARARQTVADDVASLTSAFGPADPVAIEAGDLVLVAGSADLRRGEREAVLASAQALVDQNLGSITGPGRQRVTLTGRDGEVQVLLTNTTGRPVDVLLRMRADRLDFPEHGGLLPVHLVQESTFVHVPIRARSSGDAPLDIEITTPDQRVVVATTRFTVRTTALSGVGVTLMLASLAVLAVWWVRTILADRRAARRRHPAHAARATS